MSIVALWATCFNHHRGLFILLHITLGDVVSVQMDVIFLLVLSLGYVICSPEPLESEGELIHGSSVHRLLGVHHFQRYSLKLLCHKIQISCGASIGRGNQSLYKWSRSHDQGGHHTHILGKPYKSSTEK